MLPARTLRLPPPLISEVTPLGRALVRALLRVLRGLPSRAVTAVASWLAGLAFALGIRRRVTLENLRLAFPGRPAGELERIARGAYRTMALSVVDGLLAHHAVAAEAVTVHGWEVLEQARAQGRGVLVASAHFGSWERFGELVAERGLPVHAVVRPLKGALNAELIAARERSGMRLIHARGCLQQSVAALRRGAVVAILIDQALPGPGARWVPFFGRPASTSPALAIAAARSGAPVVLGLAARTEAGLSVHFEGPLELPRTGSRSRDAESLTRAVTALLERHIRQAPEQWLWLHRRWKGTPPEPGAQRPPATSGRGLPGVPG